MEGEDEEEFTDEEESGGFDGEARSGPDGDREFEDDDQDDYPALNKQMASSAISNQPFDEAVDLSDTGSEQPSPAVKKKNDEEVSNQAYDEAMELSSEEEVDDREEAPPPRNDYETCQPQQESYGRGSAMSQDSAGSGEAGPRSMGTVQRNFGGEANSSDEDEEEAEEEEGEEQRGGREEEIKEGMYDPKDYEHLGVSPEVKELFQYIARYKPHNIELETKMRPFIADYIPAVGEIDPFVKVARPDTKPDNLGLTLLDEPCAKQSDQTVFTLQLRAVTKSSAAQPMLVRAIEGAEKNPRQISGWINSISDLHRHKPAPSVRYSKPMPDIESLMQVGTSFGTEIRTEIRTEIGSEIG